MLLLGFFILCRTASTSTVQTCKSNESESEKFHTRENGRHALALPRAAMLPSCAWVSLYFFQSIKKQLLTVTYTRWKQEIKIHPYTIFWRRKIAIALYCFMNVKHRTYESTYSFKLPSTRSNFHRSFPLTNGPKKIWIYVAQTNVLICNNEGIFFLLIGCNETAFFLFSFLFFLVLYF